MNIHDLKGKIILKWLNYKEHSKQILELRRKVFVEHQGFDMSFINIEGDENYLHLGAFFEGQLVSMITGVVIKGTNKLIKGLNLPETLGYKLQPTKRAELKEFRGTRLAELISTCMWKSIVAVYQPDYSFIELIEVHKKLGLYYSSFGYKLDSIVEFDGFKLNVYIQNNDDINNSYKKFKRLEDVISTIISVKIPSLSNHLEKNPEILQPEKNASTNNNLYLNMLSFQDELPRLLAQGRLLGVIQKNLIETIDFPKAPANLLDIGCGPGLYLFSLRKKKKLKGYKFSGMDISNDMISFARLSYRKIAWKQGSIYNTKYDAETFDVIHASFLMIHLATPEIALKELFRILKPGGILYIVDVNDSTFEGPKVIKKMINKHTVYYEGNRNILNTLPELAKSQSFDLIKKSFATVSNLGFENEITMKDSVLKLGRMKMWAMFAFISQREDVQSYYQKAEQHYFSTECEISIQIQTQVYKKI